MTASGGISGHDREPAQRNEVRFTSAHVALIVLAALPAYLGVRVLVQGLFDRSYDNALVNYLVLGGMLILLALTLVVFAVRDARRRPRRR